MARTITVTAGELKNKAGELKTLNNNFKSKVAALKEQERSLNAMWEGEANTAFHNAFEKDAGQMDEFYKLIEKYAAALEEIAKTYEEAERKNVQTATTRRH